MAGRLGFDETANVNTTEIDLDSLDFQVNTGMITVDLTWEGQDNSIDLQTLRVRFIVRDDGTASPEPNRDTIEANDGPTQDWRESTILRQTGDFWYIDVVDSATSTQMSTTGIQREDDVTTTQDFFINKTVWMMGRLEV